MAIDRMNDFPSCGTHRGEEGGSKISTEKAFSCHHAHLDEETELVLRGCPWWKGRVPIEEDKIEPIKARNRSRVIEFDRAQVEEIWIEFMPLLFLQWFIIHY